MDVSNLTNRQFCFVNRQQVCLKLPSIQRKQLFLCSILNLNVKFAFLILVLFSVKLNLNEIIFECTSFIL